MDISKLPRYWRKFTFSEPDHIGPLRASGHLDGLHDAANGLEAAMPKWTQITDDPDTWPKNGQTILINRYGRPAVTDFNRHMSTSNGTNWRPLIDLDYPPEQS